MKGNLSRKFNFSIIVTAEDLKSLSDMIMRDFKDIRFEIKTKDGAQYKIEDINDILKYTNPDSRKIEVLRIRGNQEKGKSFYLPNICVSLFDTSVYDKSIILELNEMDEKDITHYTSRIDEFANRIKAPYWLIFKERFYWITGVVLYLTFSIVYFANTDTSTTVNKVYSMMLLQGVSAMCMAFSMVVLNKVVSFFYPESCFALGEQKKHVINKEKARNIVFVAIILALIIGVIASVIGSYLVNNNVNTQL